MAHQKVLELRRAARPEWQTASPMSRIRFHVVPGPARSSAPRTVQRPALHQGRANLGGPIPP